ncbi:D-ala D-ala ligase, partial [Aspergillus sclerotialis]
MALNEYKIPNAPFRVIRAEELGADVSRITAPLTSYPLFVKLATEGSSKGVESFNKINNSTELEPAVQELKSKFPGQAIIVESFLPGREYT